MIKNPFLDMTAQIARVIAECAPKINYTEKELDAAFSRYTAKELEELRRDGYYQGNFELFYVMCRFCDAMNLWDRADPRYLAKLFSNARQIDYDSFCADPYLSEIRVPDHVIGQHRLLNVSYERGEIFQYDMPDLSTDMVVPKLGFFSHPLSFPAVYEGSMPWVSVCPSEIFSMRDSIGEAHGRVLVLGLGLGYYPYLISKKNNVSEITIVELNHEIIRLFKEHILPQFAQKDKISIVEADAFEFMKNVQDGTYDYCFEDIWEGQEDGAAAYVRLKPHEERLPHIEFSYWIEKEIRWYLRRVKGLPY